MNLFYALLILAASSPSFAAGSKASLKALSSKSTNRSAVKAQTSVSTVGKRNYKFAPTLGLAASTVEGRDMQTGGSRNGLFAAALLSFQADWIAPMVSLQIGPGFLRAGNDLPSNGDSGRSALVFNYLTLPVLVKYQFAQRLANRFHVRGGLMPAVLAQPVVQTDYADANRQGVRDSSRNWENFDTFAIVGLGMTNRLTDKYELQWDFMATRGMFDLTPNSTSTLAQYNQAFILSSAVLF